MGSVLNRGLWERFAHGKATDAERMAVQGFSVEAAAIISLMEIHEAVEAGFAKLAMGQFVVAKEIADRAGTIEEQGVEMLKGFDEIREDLQAQRNVVTELMKDMSSHAARLDQHEHWLTAHKGLIAGLAEEKQDRPEVLNGPDTARAGG